MSGVAAAIAIYLMIGAGDDPPSTSGSASAFYARTPTPSVALFSAAPRTPTPYLSTVAAPPRTTASTSTYQSISPPTCASGDCDCADFTSRAQLNLVFSGSAGDPHRLDSDNDGIPCEWGIGASAGSGSTTQPGQYIPYAGNGGGPTRCADGTISNSSGRGTCSYHGGIAR